MPTSYVQQPGATTREDWKLFLSLLESVPDGRDALLYVYNSEFGGSATEQRSLERVRYEIEQEPMRFFMLVSAFLSNPPALLTTSDRQRVADGLRIHAAEGDRLVVTEDGIWLRELLLESPRGATRYHPLRLNRYEYRLNSMVMADSIVPTPVFEYLKASAACFRATLFSAALALVAIAFEATLREVLRGLERDFVTRPPRYVQTCARVDAHVGAVRPQLTFSIAGASEDLVQFFQTMTPVGQGFLGRISFHVVREEEPADPTEAPLAGMASLKMRVDQRFVDLLSTDRREPTARRQGARRFAEFNEAAQAAGRLNARRLPIDSAEVIRQVRNHLVHWDEASLNEQLRNGQTVREYVGDYDTVRTTISDVGTFISDEYYDLREFELANLRAGG